MKRLYTLRHCSKRARSKGAVWNTWIVLSLWMAALALVSAKPVVAQNPAPQSSAGIFIKGTVRDAAGAPVSGAAVVLEEKGHGSVEGKTGADGTFSFLALRAGTYTVRVTRIGFRAAFTEPMDLTPGQTKKIEFVLKVVTDADPSPPPEKQPSPGQAMRGTITFPVKGGSASTQMEFSDAPNFTVAGVTDWSNAGLHGSDANVRTSESLNKETAALKDAAKSPPVKAGATETAFGAGSGNATEGEAHRLAGDRAEKAGDALAAEREYEAAVRSDPSEANYFAWGTELLVHKAVRPAIEVFTKGAAVHPRSARMLIGLGAALFAGNAPQEAVAKVCAAADLQPGDATAYLFVGKMQSTVAEALPCAEEKLGRFVRAHSGNASAEYYYAVALWKRARGAGAKADEVEELLRDAARIEPKLAEAHLQLGILYESQGKVPAAIEAYRRAIAANGDLADAHYRLGRAYKRVGEGAKAEHEFVTYKQAQKAESAELERQRKELQQFVIVLKDGKKEERRGSTDEQR